MQNSTNRNRSNYKAVQIFFDVQLFHYLVTIRQDSSAWICDNLRNGNRKERTYIFEIPIVNVFSFHSSSILDKVNWSGCRSVGSNKFKARKSWIYYYDHSNTARVHRILSIYDTMHNVLLMVYNCKQWYAYNFVYGTLYS